MRTITVISLIGVGILLFYWFQWRPTEIRKSCHVYAVEKALEDSGSSDKKFRDEDYNFRFKYCLQRDGLK